MNTRPHSLQARILALVLGLVALVWTSTALLTWFDTRHELGELLDSHLAQAAAVLVAQSFDGDDEEHHVDAPRLHRYASTVAFQVFHDGRLVLHSADAPRQPMVTWRGRDSGGFHDVRIDDASWRVFATRGAERDVTVFVGERRASRDAILWAVLRGTLWPLALALPVLAVAAWWAVRRGIEPLRRLGHVLATRRPQALEPIVLPAASAEVVPLVEALNGLFARISALMGAERRFTADAAHELRTPIAAIRTQAQVALAEPEPEARRHALQATLAGCDRAARLIDQLLTLSRLESAGTLVTTTVDLAALARSVAGELAPKAVAKAQELTFAGDAAALVAADETLLAVLVRNLVDNAVRYSPQGARVAVSVRRDGSDVALQVDDSGPGLDDAARRRLGERFFRLAGSEEAGSGLGWSIVQRIAAAHGFRVEVDAPSGLGGLGVRVRMRAASAD